MKLLESHRRLVVMLACLSLASPSIQRSQAAPPQAQRTVDSRDLRLDTEGRLRGQLVDRQGNPLSHAWVTLQSHGELLSHVQTNEHGEFQFVGLRGGVYQVGGPDVAAVYRAWTTNTAPPASKDAVLLVTGDALRGQTYCPPRQMGLGAGHYGGAIMRTLNNPWIIGGAIAAGIAVPIAISNNDDDDNGS